MNEIKEYTEKLFENIKHIDENGNEYWLARELMPLLEYNKWERFSNAIEYAKTSCIKSGYNVSDHFPEVGKLVQIGSKTNRKLKDYKLSRYACYLIVQNGDSRKEVLNVLEDSKIYRTDEDGGIMFRINKNKLKIETCVP